MLKRSLMAAALLATGQNAHAQQTNATGAGALLQQIPPPPVREKTAPDIRVERPAEPAPAAPPGARIRVRSLHVTGATQFTEAALIAASGFAPGSELSLTDLRAAAAKITAFYNQHGYFLARAYLPAQDIADDAVTIAVVEGRYGKIDVRNRTNLRPGIADAVLGGIGGGDVVATAPLERRLLLLSDIPGVAVHSTLVSGGRGRQLGSDRGPDPRPADHRQHRGRQFKQPLHRPLPPRRNREPQRSGPGMATCSACACSRPTPASSTGGLPTRRSSASPRSASLMPISTMISAASSNRSTRTAPPTSRASMAATH